VQQWRNVRDTSAALLFFQLATALAGIGFAGDFAQLVALGSIFAFSRDQEREADDIGFDLMVQGGYDPHEAAKIWKGLLDEREASETPERFIFFSTHPATKERLRTLRTMADKWAAGGKGGLTGGDEYFAVVGPFRKDWLGDELEKHDFKSTQVVLDRLTASGKNISELHFFRGELCRLRSDEGDKELAIKNYKKALGAGNPPSEIYRSLGLMQWRVGRHDDARSSFKQYLQVKPDAHDCLIIKSYIDELEKKP